MTQVDDKGHEGNTAAVAAYVGENVVEQTAGQDFLLTTIIYLNIISYSYINPAEYYFVLYT